MDAPSALMNMLLIPRKASNDASMFPGTTASVGATDAAALVADAVAFVEVLTAVELVMTEDVVHAVVDVVLVRLVDVVLGVGVGVGVGVGAGVGFADVVVGAAPLPNSHSPYSSPPIDGSKNANRPSVRSRLLYPHPTHCSASRQFVHLCTYSRTGRSAYAS